MLCVGCILQLAAFATSPVDAAAPPSSAKVSTSSQRAQPAECVDTYYHYLPGMIDYCLGLRHWQKGRYQNGLEFLELAAGWGSKEAQYTLGLIYYNGHHVTADRALGIAWLELANERRNDPQIALATRSAIALATAPQRERAQRLFRKMRQRYGDKVAAARAWRHFKHYSQWVAAERMGLPPEGCVVPPGAIGGSMSPVDPTQKPSFKNPKIYSGPCISFKKYDGEARKLSNVYFRGWEGRVTVGPLRNVPAPAASGR